MLLVIGFNSIVGEEEENSIGMNEFEGLKHNFSLQKLNLCLLSKLIIHFQGKKEFIVFSKKIQAENNFGDGKFSNKFFEALKSNSTLTEIDLRLLFFFFISKKFSLF